MHSEAPGFGLYLMCQRVPDGATSVLICIYENNVTDHKSK